MMQNERILCYKKRKGCEPTLEWLTRLFVVPKEHMNRMTEFKHCAKITEVIHDEPHRKAVRERGGDTFKA